MEERAGIPAAYRSHALAYDVLRAEPWSPAEEDTAGHEASAVLDRTGAGRAIRVGGYR